MQITDQKLLKESQYKTSENLKARIRLHEKYGTNTYRWHRWVYDQLQIDAGSRILEIGCGPADFWFENSSRTSAEVPVILMDLSVGMLTEAAKRLRGQNSFYFVNSDAQHLPMPNQSCDIVVANHMLYHVPDIDTALGEIKRILRNNGVLCAATNGNSHMQEVHELMARFFPEYPIPSIQMKRFGLENGSEFLSRHFKKVEMKKFNANLKVTNAQDLIKYIKSMGIPLGPTQESIFAEMEHFVNKQIQQNGYYYVNKSQGLFLAKLE